MSTKLLFDGRTLVATVVVDARDGLEAFNSATLVHEACRGPLLRMVSGYSEPASKGEREELGEMLANYGVIVRPPMCVRHKFIINTDEDSEAVAFRIRDTLNPRNLRAMVIVGEADTEDAAKSWRHAVAAAKKYGMVK